MSNIPEKVRSFAAAKKLDVKTLTKMALCIALISVSSYIAIPIPFTPVLITAQTIIVNLIALLLTPGQSVFVMTVYILMGACGLPIFSGGAGGIGKLLGPAGGYLIGFVAAVAAIGWLKGHIPSFWRYTLVTVLVGIPLIDLSAMLYMMLFHQMAAETAFVTLVLPFLVGDTAKCVAAAALGTALNRIFTRIPSAVPET